MTEQPDRDEERKKELWPWIAGGLAVVLLIFLAFLLFRGNGANQDRLSDIVTDRAERRTPEQQCASQSVLDRIKLELFRRAAQVRGGDRAAFESVAGHASVRIEAPMATGQDEDAGTVSCTGLLWLDLPPGVAVEGGRRTLSGDVIYTVRRSSGGDLLLSGLGNADAIVSPLSRLARLVEPEDEVLNEMEAVPDGVMPPEEGMATAPPGAVPPGAGTAAGPSFDCSLARTPAEVAVCNDPGLAVLDRRMAVLYGQALGGADAEKRELLLRTRERFLAYRDGCRTNTCIAGAYQGRMREIRDIIADRWQAPR